jgi:aminoglycoside phosphotransferase (APT) family kinase protein
VLDVRPAADGAPGVLLTEYVDAVRLDQLLADPPAGLDWAGLGAGLGSLLARLSGIPYSRPGLFTSADLLPAGGGLPELREYAQSFRDEGRLASWTEPDWAGLLALVDAAQDLLEHADAEHGARFVLVHSDLNPKNVLVDPATGAVRALVDWEFAHAGSRYTDVGNLTRFERDERWVAPMLETFARLAPPGLGALLECGRAADLWALVELAGGVPTNPVRELATALLLAQVRASDLGAWPFPGHRATPQAA